MNVSTTPFLTGKIIRFNFPFLVYVRKYHVLGIVYDIFFYFRFFHAVFHAYFPPRGLSYSNLFVQSFCSLSSLCYKGPIYNLSKANLCLP